LTCPLTSMPADKSAPGLDPASLAESAAHLPKPKGTAPRPSSPAETPTRQGAEASTISSDERTPNRSAGICAACLTLVEVGAGTTVRSGRRDVIFCERHSLA